MSKTFLTISFSVLLLVGLSTIANIALLKMKPENETLKKTLIIIRSWWFIIGFVLLCFATAPNGMLIGFGAISMVGMYEYLNHSRLEKLKKPVALLAGLAIFFQYLSLWQYRWDAFFFLPLAFILFGTSLLILVYAKIENLAETFASYAGIIIIFHFAAYLPALFLLQSKRTGYDGGIILIFLVIFITELNDIFQFLCGKNFGRRKVLPSISPNKTEAGFIGGLILTTLLSTILFQKFSGFSSSKSVFLGLAISIAGMLGDLTFSAIKRYFGTKDFSETLPGHGGVLDRLDSLTYTAPTVFYFIYYLGVN